MFLHASDVENKRCRRGYVPPLFGLKAELIIVYAYIPTGKDLCDQSNVMCNSDAYGTSLARGSFSYQTGQWQTIWLVVILNEVGINNGIVEYVPFTYYE
jgi:hypothetical protein